MKTITIDGVQIPTDKLIAAGWKAPEEKKSILWKPEIGERYYYITSYGTVIFGEWGEYIDECIKMYDTGNCYRTGDEAQRVVDVIKATVRVNRRIEELNEGWVPDWMNGEEMKWFLKYKHSTQNFEVDFWYNYQVYQQLSAIKSRLVAGKIIVEMRDDLCTIWGIEKEESK